MTKPNNLTKTILHCAIAVCGVLVLAFLALHFINVEAVSAAGMGASHKIGYDFLDFSNPNPTSNEVFVAVVTLLLVIFACILTISAVLAILGDFGVISNQTFTKVVKWLVVASAVAVLLLTVLHFVACSNIVSDNNAPLKVLGISPVKLAPAGLVLNLLCGAGATASALFVALKKD